MAKYHGAIGFMITKETAPGVWVEEIEEKTYSGDLMRNMAKYQSSGNVNDDINIANEISIIADSFAYERYGFMRYATYMGFKWKISHAEMQYPRIILTLGGVYNG